MRRVQRIAASHRIIPFVAVALCADQAAAGGLYINEFMTVSQGAAGAGSGAIAEDASTFWHNPAGMTRVKGRNLSVGAGVLLGDIRFDPSPTTPVQGNKGGQQGAPAPILSGFYTHQLSERWTFGAGLYSVSGAALDPSDAWAGRAQVTEITLLTLTGGAGIAYKATDWLSVGAGIGAVFGTLDFDLTPQVPPGGAGTPLNLDGTDLTYAFNVGALVELSPQTRFGVTYFSGFDMEFDGDLTGFPVGSVPTKTELDFAPVVRLHGYHELNDRFTLLGSVGWEGWSSLDELIVSGPANSAGVPRNWDDTWHFSGGLRYQATRDLMLQTGFAYDTSPTSAAFRTADTPIDRQIRVAVGARYDLREDLAINGSFVYANYGDAPIASPTLVGDYSSNNLFFLGVGLEWKIE